MIFTSLISSETTGKNILFPSPCLSSRFQHGEENFKGYMMLTDEKIEELKLDPNKYNAQDIVAINEEGVIDPSVRIYDISLSRNVVQMIISLGCLLYTSPSPR